MKKILKKNVSNEAEALAKKGRNISPDLHTTIYTLFPP